MEFFNATKMGFDRGYREASKKKIPVWGIFPARKYARFRIDMYPCPDFDLSKAGWEILRKFWKELTGKRVKSGDVSLKKAYGTFGPNYIEFNILKTDQNFVLEFMDHFFQLDGVLEARGR